MAVKGQSRSRTNTNKRTKQTRQSAFKQRLRDLLVHYLPAWVMLLGIGVMVLPTLLAAVMDGAVSGLRQTPTLLLSGGGAVANAGVDITGSVVGAGLSVVGGAAGLVIDLVSGDDGEIAPLFTDEIHYWEDEIVDWAEPHDIDPNLLATVMQIESCGHPTISSYAGAQGLFQVMPFHFATGENMTDPDTNALRGTGVLAQCLEMADGDPGMAMACYNGGPSVLRRSRNTWAAETQRYYYWATGIYESARSNNDNSQRLNEWLQAGGRGLCDMAAVEQD